MAEEAGMSIISVAIIIGSLIIGISIYFGAQSIHDGLSGISLVKAGNVTTGTQGGGIQGTGDGQSGGTQGTQPTQQDAALDTTTLLSTASQNKNPKLGLDSAKVVVIEYSDFQCPFCRMFFEQSFSQLKQNYIDTGKVQFIYKYFPLSFHPMAEKTSEASQCVAEQGNDKWEQFHEAVFEMQAKQGSGTVYYTDQDLDTVAKGVTGLDYSKYSTCLSSGKYKGLVQADMSEGSGIGITGTPGFVIGVRNGKGETVVGAYPYATFQTAIDKYLSES